MKYITYIIIVVIALFSFSCADKFINDIEIDLPEQDQKLVINLELNTNDTLVKTFVARTTNPNEGESTFYDDALVELYKNDILLAELVYNSETNDYEARFDKEEITEDTYRVEVSGVEGLTDITSTQTIPPKVNITNGSYQAEGTIYQYYYYAEPVDEALITIDDPADQENYYHVRLYGVVDDAEGNNLVRRELYITTINPIADNLPFLEGLLLKDDAFNGTSLDLSLGFYNYFSYNNQGEENDIYLIAELNTISRDSYLYLKSLAAFESADGNPFAEPVIVHNNVENGIGIFRVSNATEYRIDIE